MYLKMAEKVPLSISGIPVLPWLPHVDDCFRTFFHIGTDTGNSAYYFPTSTKIIVKNARDRNILCLCQLGDTLTLLVMHIWLWPF